jgi:NADH:ubiquinone reductase (H+-translocating)
VATGVSHHYFGRDDWEPLAPGLKSIEDATGIRRRVFAAFERAEREPDAALQREWLTFVVVGGGPTGVELAGAIGELAHHTLPRDFCRIDTRQARVHLLEAGPRILSTYDERLSRAAAASAERLGVTVRTGSVVTGIGPDGVTIGDGERAEFIAARTVVWAAGVQASPLGAALAAATGAQLDRQGRIVVGPDLAVPGHPGILVLGDLAHARQAGDRQPGGQPLPGLAPVAMQQGAYAGRLLSRRLQGRETSSFRYRDRGSMAVIGRSAAVAQIRGLRLSGFAAWLAWLFIHLLYLVEFENRLLVLLQWGWSYVTRNRSARLITGTPGSRGGAPDGPGARS